MKSKRLIIIGLIISILLIFSGCGTEKNAETIEENFLTNAFTTIMKDDGITTRMHWVQQKMIR